MSEWARTKLRGKIAVKHGFPFKSEYFRESGDYVVLTPGNFFEEGGFKRNAEKDKCYSHDFPSEYLLEEGDLIVAMTEQAEGLLGSTALVPQSGKFLHNQRLGLITPLTDEIYPEFVYHLFKTRWVREQIRLTSSGSKVKHTSPDRIFDVEVCLPSCDTQKKIAHVLTTLDAKIELNRRINAELEGMAKLLYDYWFVQFDFPLSAAQAAAMGQPELEGQPYQSSGGKMTYNEKLKREIPEGWEAGNILRIADLGGGGTPSKKKPNYWNGEIPFFTPTDAEPVPFIFDTDNCITQIGLEESSTSIFPEGALFITARGSVGKAMITVGEMAMSQSCYALVPHSGINSQFLYFHVLGLMDYLRVKSSGSIFKSIVTNDIKFSLTVIPMTDIIEQFSKITSPAFTQILNNQKQTQHLTSLRDFLLPMLMNGQVTVK